MRYLLMLAFACTTLIANAQTKHPDGPYKEYHDNGKLRKEGVYKKNKKVGLWKHYYNDGTLHKRYLHDGDGNFTGVEQVYSNQGILITDKEQTDNGNIYVREFYDDGHLYKEYYLVSSDGGRRLVEGIFKEYYQTDTLKVQSIFVKSELSGLWKKFYETGEKEWEVTYKDGYRQGEYKQFFKNGNLKAEGVFEGDFKNGNEIQYNQEGEKTLVLKYEEGLLKKSKDNVTEVIVPDGVYVKMPVYPGCEKALGNNGKKKCMGKHITQFINSKFDTRIAAQANLSGRQRIDLTFNIKENGVFDDFKAKSNSRLLSIEAVRVAGMLPNVKPGTKGGEAISFPYSVPIIFMVQDKKR